MDIQAPLALDHNNSLGCMPFESNFTGKILLIKRGTCLFGTKALNVQRAGAVAMVLLDVAAPEPFTIRMTADSPKLKTPGVSIGRNHGTLLWSALEAGNSIEVKIEGRL